MCQSYDYRVIIIWWLSDDHLKTIWLSYGYDLMIIWWSSDDHLFIKDRCVIIWLSCDYQLIIIWWSSDDHLMINWWSSINLVFKDLYVNHMIIIWLSSKDHLYIISLTSDRGNEIRLGIFWFSLFSSSREGGPILQLGVYRIWTNVSRVWF